MVNKGKTQFLDPFREKNITKPTTLNIVSQNQMFTDNHDELSSLKEHIKIISCIFFTT